MQMVSYDFRLLHEWKFPPTRNARALVKLCAVQTDRLPSKASEGRQLVPPGKYTLEEGSLISGISPVRMIMGHKICMEMKRNPPP